MSGDNESVARIVSLAADDDDRLACNSLSLWERARVRVQQLIQDINTATSGVFHQHQPRQAIFRDRSAIDFANLSSG